MKRCFLLFLFPILISNIYSQYLEPVKIPILLSGGFGELRNNHFHSGIDIKTEGKVDLPVYAVENGFVSRINVSPSGYGLALYIDHPDGRTSVYAHLNSFSSQISEYVKNKQYEQETYRIELYPDSSDFPVKKGEQIALSGNSGSSGGPHLHFEFRDTETQAPIDPLPFYKEKIKDTRAPEIRAIAVYPFRGNGIVNNSFSPLRININRDKNGKYLPVDQEIEAWGTIAFGIKAYDRMNGVNNIYGVKSIKLMVDSVEIFRYDMGSFLFSETRMLNSFIDFTEWKNNKSIFMKSYLDPGNKLPFFVTENDGYFSVNEERDYQVLYELEDECANKSSFSFTIKGKEQPVGEKNTCKNLMRRGRDNEYADDYFSIYIPKENLYANICFDMQRTESADFYSDKYQINKSFVPLHDFVDIAIKIHNDTLENKNQYGLVKITEKRNIWVGGKYENGFLKAQIRELGDEYAVDTDNKAPVITALAPENWTKTGLVKIKLTDDKSGLKSFRGTIDGKFVLFEHDMKSSTYTYKIDTKRIEKGRKHELKFSAEDYCGNRSEIKKTFTY